MMLVIGADLSYTRSAGVVLDEQFKIVNSFATAIRPGPRRYLRALHIFRAWIKRPDITLAVVEDNAYGAPSRVVVTKLSNLNTLFKVACEGFGVDWLEVSPSALKKEIAGKGTAEKAQVAQELKRLYGIEFPDDKGFDLSDACAAAVWGVRHRSR